MRGIGDTDQGRHTTQQHEGGACHAGPPCRGGRRRQERSRLLRLMIRSTRWLVVILLQWHRFGVHDDDVVVVCDGRI